MDSSLTASKVIYLQLWVKQVESTQKSDVRQNTRSNSNNKKRRGKTLKIDAYVYWIVKHKLWLVWEEEKKNYQQHKYKTLVPRCVWFFLDFTEGKIAFFFVPLQYLSDL